MSEGSPKNVLVLGGGSEIAKALLEQLALKGMKSVLLAGPRQASLSAVAVSLLEYESLEVSTCYLDLSKLDEVPDNIQGAMARLPTLDWVVVAAGELGDQEVDEHDPSRVEHMVAVNFTGPAMALSLISSAMTAHGGGTIVVMSSVAAERVRGSNYVYGSAKAGLDGYATAMGERLWPLVRVHIVRPGLVKTKMIGSRSSILATSSDRVAVDTIRGIARQKRIIWSPPLWRPVMSIYRHLPRNLARRIPL